jgi:hypothetical protein
MPIQNVTTFRVCRLRLTPATCEWTISEVAKESIAIYQSIAASCLVDRGQLFGRSRLPFVLSKFISRLSAINISPFDFVWINLPLRRRLLTDEDS